MDDDYAEAVLDLVATIPEGRAMAYGTIAEVVGDLLQERDGVRRGGPRQVGQVMSRAGSGVPWWRVVNAAGSPPARHASRALSLLADEGTPLSADGTRVALRRAIWFPDE